MAGAVCECYKAYLAVFKTEIVNNARATGTWTPGVLGQGYGSPGVPRKLMNSFSTLTSSGSGNSPFSSGGGTTRMGGGLSHYGSGTLAMGGSLKTLPGTIPKTPRPHKARQALDSLAEGLKACVVVAEEEIASMKEGVREMSMSDGQSMLQGRIYEMEKTVKATERTLKKLEYQLSLVEELGEQYNLQQRLREGVRTMAYAFSMSDGKERDAALANVKAGFKECTEVLCNLEGQLESFLGSFKMSMKGIQGFARLCPGDVFEITIKHGLQKWKTRGKIGKDGSQSWDFPRATFRVVLGEVLYIKAAEVKTLGKQVLLGNKFCEATELFSAHPQLMTVNLNPSGSLKLNIVVTWRPLEVTPEAIDYMMFNSSAPGSSSPTRKRRLSGSMSMSSGSLMHLDSSMMNTLESRNGSDALWARTLESIGDAVESGSFKFSALSGNGKDEKRMLAGLLEAGEVPEDTLASDPTGNFSLKKRDTDAVVGRDVGLTQVRAGPSGVTNFTRKNNSSFNRGSGSRTAIPRINKERRGSRSPVKTCSTPTMMDDGVTHSRNGMMVVMDDEEAVEGIKSLRDSILKLISFLEDIKGQWPELEHLEMRLAELEKMISEGPAVPTSSSDTSLNIESALECFDFLDAVAEECADDHSTTPPPPAFADPPVVEPNKVFNVSERYARHRPSAEIMDPKMTARTTDSGISSLGQMHSRSPSPTRSAESPAVPLVTGNAQLDLALETHIHLCLQLVQNLGSFGPLKSKEREAVVKLTQQAEILGEIIAIAHSLAANITGTHVVDLRAYPTLQKLWEAITDVGAAQYPVVTTADMAVHGLESEIRPVLGNKYQNEPHLSSHVAKVLTEGMLDTGAGSQFRPSAMLTVFQFQYFLLPQQHRFDSYILEVADEELLQIRLQDEGTEVISYLRSIGSRLPSRKVLSSLIRWLISTNEEAAQLVKEFFRDMSCLHSNRRELVQVSLEMMESDWNVDREAACYLVSVLEATEAIEQLAYVAQSDPASQVRSRAKTSLMSLGQDDVVEQLTLSTHGFQGLVVN